MRLGLFGGTFDPPHKGHLALARAAARELRLDRIYFIPAAQSPLKGHPPLTPARHRLGMTRAAARDSRLFFVRDLELKQGGVSYTARTLRQFRREHPDAELFLILGSDSFQTFTRWKSWRTLLRDARVAVGRRPSGSRNIRAAPVPAPFRDRIIFLKSRMPAISSTQVRSAAGSRSNLTRWVAPAVARYIRKNSLYRE